MKRVIIISLCFLCFYFISYSQTIDEGTINGADYFIIIPENWNNGLVMYAHGYEEIGEEFSEEEEEDGFMKIFTDRGYAYAASGFKRQGLVIKDGIEDTEALRSYFEMKYGKPDLCIITGHSMGGMISIATIEKYPSEYDGALPLCGWLSSVYSLLKYGLDMLVTYDYLFGENDGKIVLGDVFVEAEYMQDNLNKKPEMMKLFAEHFTLKEEQLGEVLGFYQFVLKETSEWTGGLPISNEKTIYSGFGNLDTKLNKNILRYSANPKAREYIIEHYSPKGIILDPVIALHTTYDELLPVNNYKYYEEATVINHTNNLYIQQYVVRDGHCWFEDEEVANSFNQLIKWIKEGERPKIEYN